MSAATGTVPSLKGSSTTRRSPGCAKQPIGLAYPHHGDPGWNVERHRRAVLEGHLHEVDEDGQRSRRAGLSGALRARLVESDVDAAYQVAREADEPGVLAVVRGAGLA